MTMNNPTTESDLVEDIMAVWGGNDDFRDGGLEYVAYVMERNIEDMRDSDFDEDVCVKELADQAIVALRQLAEMGHDPEDVVRGRLDTRMDGQTEDIIESYQADFRESR